MSSSIDYYGLDMTLSDPELSSSSSSEEEIESTEEGSLRPKQLLELAVNKRWQLTKTDGKDLRREILNTQLIVKLHFYIEKCKQKRMQRKRRSSGYSSSESLSPVYFATEPKESPAKKLKFDYDDDLD